MKYLRILCLLCAVLLLLCGCSGETNDSGDTTYPDATGAPIPQDLLGSWVSADGGGERQMLETITFGEDGDLTVHLDYQGSPYSTIYGTYTVSGYTIHCEITEGAQPFNIDYTYAVDGRELYLTGDDGGTAHYLRSA